MGIGISKGQLYSHHNSISKANQSQRARSEFIPIVMVLFIVG